MRAIIAIAATPRPPIRADINPTLKRLDDELLSSLVMMMVGSSPPFQSILPMCSDMNQAGTRLMDGGMGIFQTLCSLAVSRQ